MINKMFTYKPGSASGRALAQALNIKRLKHHNSKWRPKYDSVVLNWGSSSLPDYLFRGFILNEPQYVEDAANKLESFKLFKAGEVPHPEWTTSYETAREWAEQGVVVCRTLLRAHSGRGIVIAERPSEVVPAPLYTKYFKRKDEFRVHVVLGEVIDAQRKMRKIDVPDDKVNWRVRNHSNGFIFGRGGIDVPDAVADAAIKAVQVLALDFGAVDVGWNEAYNQACVFEVNTAPGLEGSTLTRYVEVFSQRY